MPFFCSVILDVDSTLCGIEGIDYLAERRGAEIGARVAAVTERAMRGEIALDTVYGERLALIKPTLEDIRALQEAYRRAVAPGAAEAITAMRRAGVQLALVSGGIRQAIEPVAQALGFGAEDLVAMDLTFDERGRYRSYDESSPLRTQGGKSRVVERLLGEGGLPRPVLAVGDGSTDVFMREHADAFAAFTGFARREHVVARADLEVDSFERLMRIVVEGARD